MAAKRDYYEILGVSKNATGAEIKSAYRRLARKHHPDIDKSSDAAEKFKEVSEAYQVLSDQNKRKTYDQFGHTAFQNGAGGFGDAGFNPFGGFRTYSYTSGNPNVEFDFSDFQDPFSLFEQFFGMGGFGDAFRRRPTYQMNLSFDEAISGTTKEIEVEKRERNGTVKRERMTIRVPAGVDDGTRMRFGEIEIVFRVRSHPEFTREGSDILSEKTLTIPQLVLGDTIEVNTIEGSVKVKIPAGTEPGALVRIKGRGVASLRGGKGDHYVRIKVDIPKNLSAKEKKLYEELKDASSKKKSWF
ncbi:MAG: Chaperone CbpA protein [Candidatus Daviesbacteria bacterium GW2011_GWA2_38_24]|uniref:Chaperone CbpA protein n=1 Tax=Candidatus Daviesbacteria bacterium GW2011_GWA2_38_24 TaxID=1618422 RepID=A0A0G0JIC3_9BACT|nr:MAG: Chaperone CbpA protein [Candidatus Daviesbacteria bacterium GW2011_GWA2_38_24]OGE22827.1 MAG: hypothetical protein A2688_02985 [Candidatus Daviesbacteria bacterium RIFCSPHIGHO2_01_FULL_38_8]